MSTKLNVKLITENLADDLISGIRNASGIYIMTSFVMQSGVRLLAPHLKQALDNGADVKVLAGDYLFITQPEGLTALTSIDPRLEARLWQSMGTSFHPKAYLFDYENGEGMLIVGSSNFSLSALKMGMEWNLAMNAQVEPYTFQTALEKFMHNFYHDATLPLNEDTILLYEQEYRTYHQKNPELRRQIMEMEEAEYAEVSQPADQAAEAPSSYQIIEPRPAQQAALDALEIALEEQYDKAMVVMATGLGKTYLAGFFAQKFKKVLFIAHREEILTQARQSFMKILPDRTFGLYNGTYKERDADCVFASIYTFGMKKHRELFAPDEFDLIIVDEFHHAAAQSYMSVLQYFRPQFLLGITATPDRMDGKDVYALCDGNVAYQLHFIEAIRRQWLAPFRYYGIYDETDYSQIRWLGSRYDEEQLMAAQLQDANASTIFEAWRRHKQTRTIAFCSSRRQADFLANYFRSQGISSHSLHSGTVGISRPEAIRKLDHGELEVIFTVDLFNEGVDIPSVDTLLFVRPTESLTVFTQQVGRGLRLHEGKEYCTIIDLIGNYRNADVKLSLFAERDPDGNKKTKEPVLPSVPAGCELNLETRVINLLDELSRKRLPHRERLRSDFMRLKQELGRIPTYLELHLHGASNSWEYRNEFGSYRGFLHWAELLAEREAEVYYRYESWLRDVEKTAMAKSYKMIVLLYMLERGADRWFEPVQPAEAASFFHRYLTEKEYRRRIDFSDKESRRLWEYDESRISKLIAEMPMSKWGSAKDSRTKFEDGQFALRFEIEPADREILHAWTLDICQYRLHVHFERREDKAGKVG
ncbi:superfamily II DNA or RNA helicase/HKD family nuclease [Paenibacillus phyllosphaerae]|uniref:Superfamily II DNA or RNA helicase/HKD family nuclease n=1 Tax=Paenibacillus phyllosphaerae TaxID=274593 RepID=A0A7W5B520_9BACL|nr:DEAD/DEAH box helicase family protein [Paenibacillus phyllosphaerae]MBB3114555.1 superfamily II DNA or RNA helicase/HKD family nuclease [Paenibacillus phyllosphaerae]